MLTANVAPRQSDGRPQDTLIFAAMCPKLGRRVAVKQYDKSKIQNNKYRAIKREIAMMMFFQRKRCALAVIQPPAVPLLACCRRCLRLRRRTPACSGTCAAQCWGAVLLLKTEEGRSGRSGDLF
jgi:hypothetical protein